MQKDVNNNKELLKIKTDTIKAFRKETLSAYIDDPDQKSPTNVRATQNRDIILKLPQNQEYMIDIVGVQQGWFKIEGIYNAEEEYDYPRQEMWIHGSVIGMGTNNYGSQNYSLYAALIQIPKLLRHFPKKQT